MLIDCIVGDQHLTNPWNSRSRCGNRATIGTRYQYINLAAHNLSRSHSIEGGHLQAIVVVFRNYQSTHDIIFASFFSLSTNSSTSFTLMPALRSAGASTFI